MLLLLREGYRHLACDQRGREEIPQTSLDLLHSNLQKLQVACLIPPVNVLLAQPAAGNCFLLSSQYHLYHSSPQLLCSSHTLLPLFHHILLFSIQEFSHFIPQEDLVLLMSSRKSVNSKGCVVIVELPGYPGLVTYIQIQQVMSECKLCRPYVFTF